MTSAVAPRVAAGGSPGAERRRLAAVLAAAAILRLFHLWAVRDQPFFARLAMDSQEYERWAATILAGDWLGAEPFFQAPLYPYLLAALHALAGPSLAIVYLAQIAVALVGLWALAWAGDRMLGAPHGLVAAALGAVYLPFVFHDVQILKESFAVSTASLLLLALSVARERNRSLPWLAAGGVLGVLALLRENALLLLPFLLPLTGVRGDRRGSARRALAFAAGLALCLAPVAVRNAALGGGLLPTTFQGGVNLWIGNNAAADGTYRPISPGKQVPALERTEPRRIAELKLGRPLSGAEVSRYWRDRALTWAAAEPAAFVRLQLRKLALYFSWYEWPDAVDYYWTKTISPPLALPLLEFGAVSVLALWGLLLARARWRALAPVLLFELGWLISTVAFFLFSRYRLPAIPGLLILAAVPLVTIARAAREGRRRVAVATAIAVVGVVAAPHVAKFTPRNDLVEFNLGRLAQEAGDAEGAVRHYAKALAANPRDFLATMNLGTLAARRGDLSRALPLLERAVELEPASDDAFANLGAARLAAGDLPGARAALARALELNAGHTAARSNRALLERRERAP